MANHKIEKVLLTGITGFIGSKFAEALVQRRDLQVYALVRDIGKAQDSCPSEVHFIEIPETTEDLVSRVDDIKPDMCFHLASLFLARHDVNQIDGLIESNVLFGTRLAEALVQCKVPYLINIGTAWQHYKSAAYDPVALYAATKQAFQDILVFYANNFPLKVLNLKFFDTYGPGDQRSKLIPFLLKKEMDPSAPLEMSSGTQWLNLTHIDDVISGLLLASEVIQKQEATTSSFSLSNPDPIRVKDFVEKWWQVRGKKFEVRWGARADRQKEMFEQWSAGPVLDGWLPIISLEHGLRNL